MNELSFYPILITPNTERNIAVLEELGLTMKRHFGKAGVLEIYDMETRSGSRLNIMTVYGDVAKTTRGIRVDVDNLVDAVAYCARIGYQAITDQIVTPSDKIILLKRETDGALYAIVQHIGD